MHDPRRAALAFTNLWLRTMGLPIMAAGLLFATGAGCGMCSTDDLLDGDTGAVTPSDSAATDAGPDAAKAPARPGKAPQKAPGINPVRKPGLGVKPLDKNLKTNKPIPMPTPPREGVKPAAEAADKDSKPADADKAAATPPADDEMNFAEKDVAPPTAAPPAAAGFELDDVFNRNVIRRATDYKGFLRKSELAGMNVGPDYNAIRLRPTTPNRFGVSIQVWHIDNPGQQTRRFNDLFRQYPDPKRTRDLGDSAFTAGWGGLRYFVWLDRKASYLAAVSCDETICKDDPATLALAKAVGEKLPEQLEKKK